MMPDLIQSQSHVRMKQARVEAYVKGEGCHIQSTMQALRPMYVVPTAKNLVMKPRAGEHPSVKHGRKLE